MGQNKDQNPNNFLLFSVIPMSSTKKRQSSPRKSRRSPSSERIAKKCGPEAFVDPKRMKWPFTDEECRVDKKRVDQLHQQMDALSERIHAQINQRSEAYKEQKRSKSPRKHSPSRPQKSSPTRKTKSPTKGGKRSKSPKKSKSPKSAKRQKS